MAAIAGYDEARGILANTSLVMVATYDQIAIVKEQAATANNPCADPAGDRPKPLTRNSYPCRFGGVWLRDLDSNQD